MSNLAVRPRLFKARFFPHVRELTNEIHRLGGEHPHVSMTRGNHIRIDWCVNGRHCFIFTSLTPGSRFAIYNARADIRRKITGAAA